jgi:osmotically-inducible protein OsmY
MAALQADGRTKSAVIDVVVDGRVLILVGTVACEDIRRAAEEIVLQLEESVTLINELKVGES